MKRRCLCGDEIRSSAYRPDGIIPTCYRCFRYMVLAKKLDYKKAT